MKAERVTPEFTPIKLEITLESLQEVQDFYNIFNHLGILDSIDSDVSTIRNTITRTHRNLPSNFKPFADKLDAYYKRKFSL